MDTRIVCSVCMEPHQSWLIPGPCALSSRVGDHSPVCDRCTTKLLNHAITTNSPPTCPHCRKPIAYFMRRGERGPFDDEYARALSMVGIDASAARLLMPGCYAVGMVMNKHAIHNRIATEMAARASNARRGLGCSRQRRHVLAVVVVTRTDAGVQWNISPTMTMAFVKVALRAKELIRADIFTLTTTAGSGVWHRVAPFVPQQGTTVRQFLDALAHPTYDKSTVVAVVDNLGLPIREAEALHEYMHKQQRLHHQ